MMWHVIMTIWSRDHPREYGENHHGIKRDNTSTGIIPANTGRIPGRPGPRSCCWDHPREYGENRAVHHRSNHRRRIIPANTGRMGCGHVTRSWRWDHPREYGENLRNPHRNPTGPGSSPRIRGEYPHLPLCSIPLRIIPANTGRI